MRILFPFFCPVHPTLPQAIFFPKIPSFWDLRSTLSSIKKATCRLGFSPQERKEHPFFLARKKRDQEPKNELQRQQIARTAPKNCLNNSRAPPHKTWVSLLLVFQIEWVFDYTYETTQIPYTCCSTKGRLTAQTKNMAKSSFSAYLLPANLLRIAVNSFFAKNSGKSNGGFSEGGFSNNRFLLKPDVAIASEVSILNKNSRAVTDFHAKKTQHIQLFENPLPGTPHSRFPKNLSKKADFSDFCRDVKDFSNWIAGVWRKPVGLHLHSIEITLTTLIFLPFLAFLDFLAFFVARNFLAFLSVFPFFPRDFRGSAPRKNPCFFGWFSLLFPKKQGKEDQGIFRYLRN